ncbi:MAG: SurA N-terminal domain-containing protein [Kiritimatiellae bacterium]|nr:SurA N-terminal domain-containing protein [Kiritimatiellia bacterium]
MFIYHFNRMIRSRLLWLLFAIVIAVAFLSMDSCYRNPGGRSGAERAVNAAGTLAGEPVSYEEYDFARRMMSATTSSLEPAATETQIWAHIAAMRTAREMGIAATRREVAERILNTPDFQVAGVFDRNRYEQVVAGIGMTVPVFERMQSEYIVLYKLMAAITAGATASPMAVDDELAQYTDIFSLRYATVANAHAGDDVDVADDDIAAYYEKNKGNFALPDRVQVRYVALATTNFTGAVELEDVEADVQDIYDTDPSRYTRRGTNGVEQLTLEEARPQIIEELTLNEAVHIATTNLAAFMEVLGPADADEFSRQAAERGLETADTSLFAQDAPYIAGIEPAALDEFRSEASDLDAARADALYSIARGRRNVYLMRILANDPAHTQPLDVVTNTIRPLVVAEKRQALFDADVQAALDALKAAVEGKDDFAGAFSAACAELSLPVSTNISFSVSDEGVGEIEHARELVRAVVGLKAGDISEPVKTRSGALLVALEGREGQDDPDQAFEVASTRERIARQSAQAIDALYFAEWLIQNLNEKGFTSRVLDNLATPADEDEHDDEE